MNKIYDKYKNNLNQINIKNEKEFNKIKQIVTISGLCHDIGHGPYSHLFDRTILPQLNVLNWEHQQGSQLLIDNIF